MSVALRLPLPADRTSPTLARAATREALGGRLDPAELEQAVLVVSELVTNAVLHAGTPCELRLDLVDGRLRVGVRDGDTRPPVRRLSPSDGVATGRGMRMLQAMGDGWGVDEDADGKVVWWELALTT